MGKVKVEITKLENGNYKGESYYNHDTGLAAIGGGHTLYSEITKDGKVLSFSDSTYRGRHSLIDKDGDLPSYISNTEKLHYNAHIKSLQEFLNPDLIKKVTYSKYIILENGRSTPEIVEARPIKNSLEIKGAHCVYTIRSGEWVELTDYKLKYFEKYNQLKDELSKIKQQLFSKEKPDEV